MPHGLRYYGPVLVLVPTNTTSTAAYAAVIPKTSLHVPSDNPAVTKATNSTESEDTIKLFWTELWTVMMIIGIMSAMPPNMAPQILVTNVFAHSA